jgi:hypothetical protein
MWQNGQLSCNLLSYREDNWFSFPLNFILAQFKFIPAEFKYRRYAMVRNGLKIHFRTLTKTKARRRMFSLCNIRKISKFVYQYPTWVWVYGTYCPCFLSSLFASRPTPAPSKHLLPSTPTSTQQAATLWYVSRAVLLLEGDVATIDPDKWKCCHT